MRSFGVGQLGDAQECVESWAPRSSRARARSAAVSVEVVPRGPIDPGQDSAACERAYLSLLCGYEIRAGGNGLPADPAELKLEVYAAEAYGVDVFKM